MTNINKEELEKIIEEIKAKTESDSVIIVSSNKAAIKKLEDLLSDRTDDVEIIELSDHLTGTENNDKCYIIPRFELEPIKIKYEENNYYE